VSDITSFDFEEFNRGVVEEFRANRGRVARFAGAPVLLVNHRGAKTGTAYSTPLVYTRDGDSYVVIASKGGHPEHPHWFRNLVAGPEVTIEVGAETIPVTARVTTGEERARLFAAQAEQMPNFADYAKATTREIPVVVFERR
jgi:deazaflavin-dependent oxidoreductase (nitroreductase family)